MRKQYLASGQPACLVLEDERPLDAVLPKQLATYRLPEGFDVCFVTSGFAGHHGRRIVWRNR